MSTIHTSYTGMTHFSLKAAVVGKSYRSAVSVTTVYLLQALTPTR